MNQQPEPYVGTIVSILLFILFVYHFIKSYNSCSQDIRLNDLFTIGYIEDKPIQIVNVKNNLVNNQLYNDCIDALHALGMKKSEAKRKAKFIFDNVNPAPENVQDFLMIALKN